MKLSTRARYGTRALLDLALQNPGELVLLKNIAQRQKISLSYLEHLIAPLTAAGIIGSIRGPQGGIRLVKAPEDINLAEVVKLLEGSIAPAECISNPETCNESDYCVTRELWSELYSAMNEVLESTTLQDLIDKHNKTKRLEKVMHYK